MVKKTNHLKVEYGLQYFRKSPPEAVSESGTVLDEGSANEAQRFCMREHAWLVNTANHAALKRGLKDSGEDLAHEVYEKIKNISDHVWAGTQNKKSYLARVIVNKANDLCHKDQPVEPLTDNILVSTPVEAMDASILITELYDKLSVPEKQLLELIFEQYSGAEIAAILGVESSTARKRISRLLKKLSSLSDGQASRNPQLGGKI